MQKRKNNKEEKIAEKFLKIKNYKYPEPSKIKINEADLQLILRDYESFMKDKISYGDLLAIIPAWAILFTSSFDDFWIFSGEELKGTYSAFIFLATVYILKGKIPFLKNIFNNKNSAIEVINKIKNAK